ncbi:putative NADPH-dependent methylglyoxal reductase Grp2p [[Candida] anglica]|uniref:NADPH-dependent methylglyoxal reductase Grp2p n=1 Tax=[Candida] anglica TaxID=148631 RepID=A0ABP0ELM6_9ASCO
MGIDTIATTSTDNMNTQTIFVSGATGFIAQHLILQLLAKGYKVVGSVRSIAKGENLQQNMNSKNFNYEIVEDLQKEGAFETALLKHPDVTVFIHTASPVTFDSDDVEKDLLFPAINGTKNVLAAIKNVSPQITRVVITSSIAAIMNPDHDPTIMVDESTWNPTTWELAKINGCFGYFASKKFAERAAWEFLESERPNFTLTTINPAFVFGPQAFDSEVTSKLNLSNAIISDLLKIKPGEPVPDKSDPSIDVRDVATAHIIAIEKIEAIGKRIILKNEDYSNQLILDAINKGVPELRGKIAIGTPGTKKPLNFFNDQKSRQLLGLNYTSLETSVIETVRQFIKYQK